MTRLGTFQKLRPLSLLEHLSSCYDSAHLRIYSNSVSWSVYLEQGKITYASHSSDPFERLERHLRRLNNQITIIDNETLNQLRLMVETDQDSQLNQNHDYKAICWLVNHKYISHIQAATLIEELIKEVIESFLLVKEGTYELGHQFEALPKFCRLELQPIVEYCQKQLQGWQSLGPQIWSPYQRPYFLLKTINQHQLSSELQQKFSAMLKGFSFRHLAVLQNQDELQLARSLQPYIINETISLYEPLPPFERLPKTFEQLPKPLEPLKKPFKQLSEISAQDSKLIQKQEKSTITTATAEQPLEMLAYPTELVEKLEPTKVKETGIGAAPVAKSIYTIVCVDDSPTILQEISNFLDDEIFSVFTVNDPVKALMQIVRHKPDLILLDVKMANIDGYELCRLLRNHSLFKNKPIIMVTGNTGMIDRVKARLVGASGYLTKPFTKADLLKTIFKHLT